MLSIDPGLNTGLSFWQNDHLLKNQFFSFKGKTKNIPERIFWLSAALNNHIIADLKKIDLVIIEGVSLWGNSTKSQVAARSGATFLLAYLVGAYIQVFQNLKPEMIIELVDVRTWKGNLSEKVMFSEVEQLTGVKPQNEHVACSMGIGLWKIGRF
jgi:hypothetical protein